MSNTINFSKHLTVQDYHTAGKTYIGVTKDSVRAMELLVCNVCVMKLPKYKWPKECRAIEGVRYILKEMGRRNFLVVTL